MEPLRFLGLQVIEISFLLSLVYLPSVVANWAVGVTLAVITSMYLIHRLIQKILKSKFEASGKYVFITGCDSGFGHALAKRLDSLGASVFAGCLDRKSDGAERLSMHCSERLQVLPLDVTNEDSIKSCISAITERCGESGLWALINNAGIQLVGPVELMPVVTYKQLADVNLYGTISTTKAALPLIRKAQGRVVIVTSVKGLLPLPFESAYCATKYGLEGFSDSLRLEMQGFGVKVSVVEPCNFGGATAMWNANALAKQKEFYNKIWDDASSEVQDAYGRIYIEQAMAGMKASSKITYPNVTPVTDALEEAVLCQKPATRYLVQGGNTIIDIYKILAVIKHWFPESWSDFAIHRKFTKDLTIQGWSKR